MTGKNRRARSQLQTVRLRDPLDPFYPFSRDLYEDENVVYHGTWSTHCASIEEHGMGRGYLAYRQADIDALCDLGLRFGITGDARKGGLTVLIACASGVEAG